MFCSKCGKELGDVKFCPNCGLANPNYQETPQSAEAAVAPKSKPGKRFTTKRKVLWLALGVLLAIVIFVVAACIYGLMAEEPKAETDTTPNASNKDEKEESMPMAELDAIFSNNLKNCLSEIGIDIGDVDEIHPMDDWYNGKRYQFEYDGHNFYIYANADDSINSINMDVVVRNEKKEMVGHIVQCYLQGYEPYKYTDVLNDIDNISEYENNKSRKEITSASDKNDANSDTIILHDGQLGQYGKQDGEYIDFYVPAGKYVATSKSGNVKIALVSDADDEDYTFIAEFSAIGQTKTIKIKSGYHIELTIYGEVELSPIS